jgi:hypothetical protein
VRESRRMASIRLVLLFALTLCILSCAAAWIYQAACSFKVATPVARTPAGGQARFRLWQSDCLLGAFARGCYEAPVVQLRGLPQGATIGAVEWLDCHQSDLVIATEATVAPGSYRLTIGREDALFPGERAVLEIVAP